MGGGDVLEAYGYSIIDNSKLIELSECTLVCSLGELEELIRFLEEYKRDLTNGVKNELWKDERNVVVHRHYSSSIERQVDFIIASRFP